MSKKNEKTLSMTCSDLVVNIGAVQRDDVEVLIQKNPSGYRIIITTNGPTYYSIDYDINSDEKSHTIRRTVEVKTLAGDIIRAIVVRTDRSEELLELIQDAIHVIQNPANIHNPNGFIQLIPNQPWRRRFNEIDGVIRIENGGREDETIQSIVMLFSSELRMDVLHGGTGAFTGYRNRTNSINVDRFTIEDAHEVYKFLSDIGGKYESEICAHVCNFLNRMLVTPKNWESLMVPVTSDVKNLIARQRNNMNCSKDKADPYMDDPFDDF